MSHSDYEKFLQERGKMYWRKYPVRAVRMDNDFTIQTGDGIKINGRKGDYVVQDMRNSSRPWVIIADIFDNGFELLTDAEAKTQKIRFRKLSDQKEKLFEEGRVNDTTQ